MPGKIEVVELFWYGCPHCYHFEPVINPWVDKLPKDVNFKRVPAMFGGPWDARPDVPHPRSHGRRAQDSRGGVRCHQNQRKHLTKPEEMADFLATQGVDKDKFLATFNSFAIKGQVNQSKELAKKYEITGVPSMVVNGKYRFDLGTAGGRKVY